MKLEKKHYIVLGIAIAVILLAWYFLKKKPAAAKVESSYDPNFMMLGSNSDYSASDIGGLESGFAPMTAVGMPTKIVAPAPAQKEGCGTGWKPCYYCNGWNAQGDCNSWVTKCCSGSRVSEMPKKGFQESGFATATMAKAAPVKLDPRKAQLQAAGGQWCERCKDGCKPPCNGSCVEYVRCPGSGSGGTNIPSVPL